ncbi:MAG TPA: sigma-70 family RNA polymerase sigma factor [Kofleriaceae bacterium]|nr:sigma-70 family RNA polymerase sigma factor [Kofleriaceae bacterium]
MGAPEDRDDRDDRDDRAASERAIHALCQAGAYPEATTAALRLYGVELLGFLQALANHHDLATEAFAELGEDLWKGLPRFRWQSSLRSWLYSLARNALAQLRRDPRRRVERNLPLSLAPDMAAVVRTVTLEIQRSEVKDEFRLLREQLDPEEHELLLLRLDRGLAWKDIARVLGGDDDVDARAAVLRKRFERAKQRLKKLAIEHGLLQRG